MASEYASVLLTVKERVVLFQNKMRVLNKEFLRALNEFYAKKNTYDFTDTMESYTEHVQQLRDKYKLDKAIVALRTESIGCENDEHASVLLSSKERVDIFRNKISILNSEFLKALNGFYEKKQTYDFTDTIGSYTEHVQKLRTKLKVKEALVSLRTAPPLSEATSDCDEIIIIENPEDVPQRKKLIAKRRNNSDSSKIDAVCVASTSKPTVAPVPSFGDLSVITNTAPESLETAAVEPFSLSTIRKRNHEKVILNANNQPATSTVQISPTTIQLPKPSKEFWKDKTTGNKNVTSNNAKSSNAFLGKDAFERTCIPPPKFPGRKFPEFLIPKTEVVECEEPDAILRSQVSVFKFDGIKYTKLGVGMLHVKEIDGKPSVLIRDATETVWLNEKCNKEMKATKMDEEGDRIKLTYPSSSTKMTTLMIRFETANEAKKFADKIEQLTK